MIGAIATGFFIGSLPTADLAARLQGIDLRRSGSGNPGTANALRLGGRTLAAIVLASDLVKGAIAAVAGGALGGSRAALAAAVAAVFGQVRNPWFGFRGGKGLGVAAGATVVVWPWGLVITAPVVGLAARALRTSGGVVIGLIWMLGVAMLWAAKDWAIAWGVPADDGLVWYAIGVTAVTGPKFATDLARRKG